MKWVTFAKTSDCKPGTVISGFQYGQEIAIVCDPSGKLYALPNKLPPTGQPATLGSVENGTIVEPISMTAFSLKTGKVVGKWCPSPLGQILLKRIIPKQDVPVYKCRKQGSAVQVLINVNAKAQFESGYWRGILDGGKGQSNDVSMDLAATVDRLIALYEFKIA